MPMRFPDLASLILRGKARGCEILQGETESMYRERLAEFVQRVDPVEAHEIRTGKPWDEWNKIQKTNFIKNTIGVPKLLNLHLGLGASGQPGEPK